jgi:hypothetical protein
MLGIIRAEPAGRVCPILRTFLKTPEVARVHSLRERVS